MTRLALITLAFLVIWMVFTTVFAISAERNEVRALPKWAWVLLCVVVPFFGGLLYLMVGRPLGKDIGGTGKGRTIAPEDDPNFLRDINRFLKKRKDDNDPK